ncbi:hypothetical protein, partial [Alcanivorax sp. 1008]|uniref:hypothetical protein n=1 Tax=Alcanivorax sp. 1008 TaxID=2816853 RepID=UPI001D2C8B8A
AADDLLAFEAGARLDDSLNIRGDGLGDWEVLSVLDPADAALRFRGRIIGSAAYDNKTTAADRTDYKLDYPDAAVYTMVENDAARFSGSAFDEPQLIDLPFRIARTGAVGAVLHDSVMAALPEFYQVTIYMACVNPDIDAACAVIPAEEIGPGLNYPVEIDNDSCDETCEDDDPALTVTKEKPRGGAGFAFASGSFNLQFLDDGTIVTDRAGECRPLVSTDPLVRETASGTIEEYRVGYVSRTLPDSNSANVLLFMAGSASDGGIFDTLLDPPPMPHFGTQIQARLDLAETGKPMFRLGDDNFEAGIRAFWQDFYQPARYAEDFDTYTGAVGLTLQALAGGAASGVELDLTCVPVSAAPPPP